MSATLIDFGSGDWVMGSTTLDGSPAVIMAPAPERLVPGQFVGIVTAEDMLSRPGAVVMRFLDQPSTLRFLDHIALAVAIHARKRFEDESGKSKSG